MTVQLFSRAVIQQVTQRVLAGVLEQLPQRLAQREGAATASASDVARVDAAALEALRKDLQRSESEIEQLRARVTAMEARLGWRAYVNVALAAVVAFGVGFVAALIVSALG